MDINFMYVYWMGSSILFYELVDFCKNWEFLNINLYFHLTIMLQ